jgi:hypothetical protein
VAGSGFPVRPPGRGALLRVVRRARVAVSATLRLAVILVVIAALVAAPLFLVYRSEDCRGRGEERTRWSFVAPWDDPPVNCRDNDNGWRVLLEELGLD